MKTLLLILAALMLTGCLAIHVHVDSIVGENKSHATVDGSPWAEVSASCEVTSDTAKATAGRDHSVINNLGTAAIGVVGGYLAGAGM